MKTVTYTCDSCQDTFDRATYDGDENVRINFYLGSKASEVKDLCPTCTELLRTTFSWVVNNNSVGE